MSRGVKVSLVATATVAAIAAAAAIAALVFWPQASLARSATALARVQLPGFAGCISAIDVRSAGAGTVPAALRRDEIWPLRKVPAGERLTVSVTVRRPGWAAWLVGGTQRRSFSLTTPRARLLSRIVQVPRGQAVTLTFDKPVAVVSVQGSSRRLPEPRASVPLGSAVSGRQAAGSAVVAAAARSWEQLSDPQRVSWFPAEPGPQALADPTPGGTLSPGGTLTLTFSKPVAEVLGASRPVVRPATPGSWRTTDAYTMTFRPSGAGFALGEQVSVSLPTSVYLTRQSDPRATRTITWQVPEGSTLRLQQLLAQLGYLPLSWQPSGAAPSSLAAQLAAAVSPPAGTFSWRDAAMRRLLGSFWQPGESTVLVRGALMAFQADHGLTADGLAGPSTWTQLLRAAQLGQKDQRPYDYISVSTSLPETLRVWQDGRVVYTSAANTGIAARPTELGTFPVYARYRTTTMSGTNADGTPYHDPGVPYVAYFNGGDAVHGFPRSSYGFPQSLGCVELPYVAARVVFGYDPIGTLVTVS